MITPFNPSPSLIARLILSYHDNKVLHSGFNIECLTPTEIDSIREYLVEHKEINRHIYHIQILPKNGIRRDKEGKPDGDLYILWNAKDWEIDVRKREEDKKGQDMRSELYNKEKDAVDRIARAMAKKMGIDPEMCKGIALSIVKQKHTMMAEKYGVDISWVL